MALIPLLCSLCHEDCSDEQSHYPAVKGTFVCFTCLNKPVWDIDILLADARGDEDWLEEEAFNESLMEHLEREAHLLWAGKPY